jgi:hypothetical protein
VYDEEGRYKLLFKTVTSAFFRSPTR